MKNKQHIFNYFLGSISSFLFYLPLFLLFWHSFNRAEIGLIVLFFTAIKMFFYLSGLGFDQVYVRFYYEKSCVAEKINLFTTITATFLLVGLCLFLVSSLFRADLLFWTYGSQDEFLFYATWLGACFYGIKYILRLFLRLAQRSFFFAVSNFSESGLFFITFMLMYWCGLPLSVKFVIKSYLISQLLLIICFFLMLLFKVREFVESLKIKIEWRALPGYFAYGYPFVFSRNLYWLFENVDKYFLLHWLGVAEVGIYTIAFALFAPLIYLENLFNRVWIPQRNQMLAENLAQAKQYCTVLSRKIMGWFCLIFVVIISLMKIAIHFLPMNSDVYLQTAMWFSYVPLFLSLVGVVASGLIYAKKSFWNIFIMLIALFTNLVACTCLIPCYGCVGAAIALAISMLSYFLLKLIVSFYYLAFKFAYSSFIYICLLSVVLILNHSLLLMMITAACLLLLGLKLLFNVSVTQKIHTIGSLT